MKPVPVDPKLDEDEPEVKAAFSERALARVDRMLILLADIAETSDSDACRVAAIKEIMDRALGKPAQTVIQGPQLDPATTGVQWDAWTPPPLNGSRD